MASPKKKRILRDLNIPGARGSEALEQPAPTPAPEPVVKPVAVAPKPKAKTVPVKNTKPKKIKDI
jgi:hypothetical protein